MALGLAVPYGNLQLLRTQLEASPGSVDSKSIALMGAVAVMVAGQQAA